MDINTYKNLFEKEFENDITPEISNYSNLFTEEETIHYPLNTDYFYSKTPPVTLKSHNNFLKVMVNKNTLKTLYLSYLTLDTKFEYVPNEPLVSKNENESFYIDIDLEVSPNIEVIPYIIFYNQREKVRMKKIYSRHQYIKFMDNESVSRLTFKIKGFGNFILKSISAGVK